MSEEWTRGASPEGLAALTAALEQEDPPACGAVHPEHPGTHCRQSGGHRGPHMTARRDVEWDNAYLSKPGTPAPAAPLGPIDEYALDNAYRERNAVVAALIRTNGYPASLMPAPDAEGWWIVYAETPLGQVSWHVNPVDVGLFDDVPRRDAVWDGHGTDLKYERVADLGREASR